ncbi:MAG: 3-keto-5-aminohexanoate cleavage protein [Mangrovicoccus sp.]|nr:3-keto-5-aminohexanoate cleavage protein [Mangrovicoccus sp.]
MAPLPQIMVAPNGARMGPCDHPALPITLPQILETARACYKAGAKGLHLHLRDEAGGHLLDAGAYGEALAALREALPNLAVQITTEAVGQYSPQEQRDLVRALTPPAVSIGLRENLTDGDHAAARRLYEDCAQAGSAVQHILYAPEDLDALIALLPKDLARAADLQLLFVLGSHGGRHGTVQDLNGFLMRMTALGIAADWAACCFGPGETHCLTQAYKAGGKLRVGFENNWIMADGSTAPDNAARVAEIAARIAALAAL